MSERKQYFPEKNANKDPFVLEESLEEANNELIKILELEVERLYIYGITEVGKEKNIINYASPIGSDDEEFARYLIKYNKPNEEKKLTEMIVDYSKKTDKIISIEKYGKYIMETYNVEKQLKTLLFDRLKERYSKKGSVRFK